jgi:hypothetical protein
MAEWIASGVIVEVAQIGLEIHTHFPQDTAAEKLSALLDVFRALHQKGFRLISSTNNDCVGKSADYEKRYLNLAEIVFLKV